MRSKYIILSIFAIAFSLQSFSQTTYPRFDVDGYVKYMQTTGFTDVSEDWVTDNLLHNRLDFSYYPVAWFSAKLSVRTRMFYGQQVQMFNLPGGGNYYADMIDVHTGFLDLSWNYLENKSFFLNSSIDRAYIDFHKGKWNVTIGRHRINWGQTFVWNANDIFNTYSYFDFDYEEKPGSDAVRVQYNLNFASRLDFAAAVNNDTSITAACLFMFNKFNYDFQFLAGVFHSDDYVFGFGFSGILLNGSFRGETSYFHPTKHFLDSTGTLTASIGYDYVLRNGLMFQLEALFNMSAEKDASFNITDYYNLQLSAKNLSFSRFSVFASISYPISPITNIALSGMYSPQNNFVFVGPSLSVSMGENFMVDINAQLFSSDIPQSEGGKGAYVFLRGRWSF